MVLGYICGSGTDSSQTRSVRRFIVLRKYSDSRTDGPIRRRRVRVFGLFGFETPPSPPTGLILPPTIRADVFHRLRRRKKKAVAEEESVGEAAGVLSITCRVERGGPRYARMAGD